MSDNPGNLNSPFIGFTFGAASLDQRTSDALGSFAFGKNPLEKMSDKPGSNISSTGFTFDAATREKTVMDTSGRISKLLNDFKNLFINGEDSDVVIKVKDAEFRAHKNILRARSPVFYSMFSHDMAEKNNGTVDIIDCEPEAFKLFLLYLYSGSVENFSMDTVFDLYGAADKYDTEELKHKCKEFMVSNLTVDSVCDVIEHALQYNEEELLKTATIYFTKKLKKVILTVKWQSFLQKNAVAANELLIKATNCYVLKNK